MHDFKTRLKTKGPAIAAALVILVLLVGLDQWTKWAIVKSIPLGDSLEVVPGFFELTHVRNTGAAFSSFDGIGMWFFILLTIVALGVMIYYFFKSDNSKIDFALALIMAGALGNLIDRIRFGYVRDFFLFYIFGAPFAVFNVADVCITLGFVLLFVSLFWQDRKEQKQLEEKSKILAPKQDQSETSSSFKGLNESPATQDTIKLDPSLVKEGLDQSVKSQEKP
ncbi:MAG: signal peptidase II [Allobaculum sp.]|nr:signal peptidase II [Allobaculum sp.]